MWAKNVDWPSLMQMEELRTEIQQISDSSGTIGRSKGAPIASHQQISVTVVTEFVRWNEEAISRCNLFSSQVITCSYHLRCIIFGINDPLPNQCNCLLVVAYFPF